MTTARPTLYAQRGLEFVAVFQMKFITFDVSGHRPLLRDPPGESTAGGKLATQHIVLVPTEKGAPAWTVGSVNVATESAKLRTYECMSELHRTRFRSRPFPLDRQQYQRFLDAATAFMQERGMAVELESALPELGVVLGGEGPGAAEASPERGSGALVWIFGGVFVTAAAIAFLALRGYLRF